jgi:hypothetical protein
MDEKIMNFIKCSARLLQNHKITIELNQINWKTLQRWINAVHAFCLDYKIDEFILHNLNDFNQIFPGILDDHVQFVRLWVEMNNTDDFGNILNWLTKQSNTNGKQRIIDLGLQEHRAVFTQLFNRIKEVKSRKFKFFQLLINFRNFPVQNCPATFSFITSMMLKMANMLKNLCWRMKKPMKY